MVFSHKGKNPVSYLLLAGIVPYVNGSFVPEIDWQNGANIFSVTNRQKERGKSDSIIGVKYKQIKPLEKDNYYESY